MPASLRARLFQMQRVRQQQMPAQRGRRLCVLRFHARGADRQASQIEHRIRPDEPGCRGCWPFVEPDVARCLERGTQDLVPVCSGRRLSVEPRDDLARRLEVRDVRDDAATYDVHKFPDDHADVERERLLVDEVAVDGCFCHTPSLPRIPLPMLLPSLMPSLPGLRPRAAQPGCTGLNRRQQEQQAYVRHAGASMLPGGSEVWGSLASHPGREPASSDRASGSDLQRGPCLK
jgi:hypothetical protein